MFVSSALVVAGLALLLGGGHFLVLGAAGLARSLRVPPIVIGLTLVAFGTSAPELAVSVIAAIDDKGSLVFGNVVGSNLANIGMILGGTALFCPLAVHGGVLAREIPMTILASLAVVVLALAPDLSGLARAYERTDGLCLLLFFSIFLYALVGDVVRARRSDPFLEQARDEVPGQALGRPGLQLFLVLLGSGGLVVGGRMLVSGATDLALTLGIPDAVVGLTIVAVGTSLPELATSLIAARQGETDLAVGNVVGSNVFNALLVLGTAAAIGPIELQAGAGWDLTALVIFSIVLLQVAWTNRRIGRIEGLVLLLAWLGYTGWRLVPPGG